MENNKNAKRLVLFVTILMLFTLMNANVTKVLASNKPTFTPTLFGDDNGNKQNETHEANTSVWKYANGKHWNPCKVSGCTDETHKWNEANHNGTATCKSEAKCSVCDTVWGKIANHKANDATEWEKNENIHFQVCKWCNIRINEGEHKYDGEHNCITCGYANEIKHHYFERIINRQECAICEERLIISLGSEVTNLPYESKYTVAGCVCEPMQEKSLSEVVINFNYPPYETENKLLGADAIKIDVRGYDHSGWRKHADKLEKLYEGGRGLPSDINSSFLLKNNSGRWGFNIFKTHIFNGNNPDHECKKESDTRYVIKTPETGHYMLYNVLINNVPIPGSARLYVNGNCSSKADSLYAYLNVVYRDIDGNLIPDAPSDNRQEYDIQPSGYSLSKNVSADNNTLDSLGWRYKGYKKFDTYYTPSEDQIKNTSITGENSNVSINFELDFQKTTIVFIYEPIKVTVNHLNSDRETKIITNKNIEYKLPEIINKTGHVCTNLECTHKEITEEGRVPGTTATMHNNTSLNKYLWPGYILTDYTLKTSKGKTIESKKYELVKDYPIEDATTRTATSGDDEIYGINNAPQELYQKTIDIPVNIDTGDKVGYRNDIELDFIYTNVDVKVSHRDFKSKETLKDTENNPLAYTEMLNGHYFILSSLILNGTNTLPQTGGKYNYTGYILRHIEVTKKDKMIWDKPIEYGQSDTNGIEAIEIVNMLYYILSSNDVTSEIMEEINRIGSDIEFKFYYEKVPMLTIKHQDEYGNKLWPDEHTILNSEITPADSKNLKKFSYVYKEYYLDDPTLKTPGTEAIQLDPDSDVRRVNVPKNGELDRELIFVYREDIPTLLVKYIDTSGNEILKTVDDAGNIQPVRTIYKMDKDSVSTSAKDLSGIKDEAGNSYNYIKYKLYEGDNVGTPVTNEENNVITVTVPKTGNNRLLEFIYEKEKDAIVIDPSQIKSESVILKSNYRPDEAGKNGEEYNVLRAIPTSEDLYANVITDSFLLSNVVSQEEKEQWIHVKLVQPYYKTNNEDDKDTDIAVTDETYVISSENYVKLKLPYSYFTAKNVQLNLISRAVVKNESIEVRDSAGNIKELDKVTLTPKYEKKPELQYKAGGDLVFKDLALDPKYAGMTGKTVEEYVEGMAAGDYNLVTGFYNVKEVNGEIYVEYVLPEIQYTEVDLDDMRKIVGEYEANPYLLTRAAEVNEVTVTMDTLKVLREDDSVVTVLSGAALPINREFTLIQLESMKVPGTEIPIIDTTPDAPLISNNVLYKKDEIYITETQENKEYVTTADVWYKPHQRVNPETLQVEEIDNNEIFKKVFTKHEISAEGEILVEAKKDIVGNLVFVHTPVVNDTVISDNSKGIANNQLISAKTYTKEQKKSILVLGQEFKIKIPNKGTHVNETGYGTKAYNYKGLVSDGDTQVNNIHNAFALDRQIKFTFGVIYNNKYYKANEWISLGVSETEEFTFVAPEWEKELWKNTNNHKIETRVIAENATSDARIAKTQEGKNTVRDNYVATKTIDVKLIGELLDLEIRATNDPSYSNYKNEGTSGMPIGQAGQANGGKAYKYGIKLGYSVYFDITSTGWTGDTTDKIELTPKYYYVSKNGGAAKPVELYYRVVGNPNYVSLNASPRTLTTIMSTDAIRGPRCKSRFASLLAGTSGFFNANAGIEMSNTTRLINALKAEAEENYVKTSNKGIVNYGTQITTGTTKLVSLPYQVRLAYANAINAMLNGKYNGVTGLEQVSENAKNYCIGHWYGAFKLPATTVAVDPGSTPKPDKSNIKKDGYIIVSFEGIKSESGGTPYLEVGPERFALDGGVKNFTLPNEKPGSVPILIPSIIYETDIPANLDAEVGGTH